MPETRPDADRIRVLEVGRDEGGAGYCGKLFARWGADVTRIDLPAETVEEGLRAYLHLQKRPAELEELSALLGEADVLISDLAPAEVERMGLDRAAVPVKVFITPFGRVDPHRDAPASAATLLARGGYTFLSGDPGRAPLTMPGRYPYYQAGSYAYVAALSHLIAGSQDVTVDVSVLETVVSLHQFTDTFWTFQQIVRSRHGNRWQNLCPTTLLPCADGWLAVNVVPNFWSSFALWVGGPELADDESLALNDQRMLRQDEVESYAIEAFRDRGSFELFREGQEAWRVPVGYVPSLTELLSDPHLLARDSWQSVRIGERFVQMPGTPFRIDGEPPPSEGADRTFEAPPLATGQTAASAAQRPLEGLRVVDMTRIWSGPLATRMLGDLGADVLKIEAPTGRGNVPGVGSDLGRPWNQQPLFNKLNRNKRSIALDLKQEDAREVFLRLVAEADVLVENFSARAMERLGLGYEVLRQHNPRLVYMQMPAFGRFGPYRDYVGLGPSIEPLSGLTALMGYGPDEPRVTAAAITDAAAGVTAATAILTALSRRERTGEGVLVDLSQSEAMTAYLGEFMLEAQTQGREPERLGNGHALVAPHGVYRCAGDDRWICITAMDDDQWDALCAVAGRGWEADARFASVSARLSERAALDVEIEYWTSAQERDALVAALLEAGVAAAPVQSAPEYLVDPFLVDGGYYSTLTTPDSGTWTYDGSPVRTNGERGYESWVGSPGLGEHNDEALRRIGYGISEINQLRRDGVVVDRPPA